MRKNKLKGKQNKRKAEMARRSTLANDSKVKKIVDAILAEPQELLLVKGFKGYSVRFKGIAVGWTRYPNMIEGITLYWEKRVNIQLDFNIPIIEKQSDPTEQERQAKQDEINSKDLGSVLNAILGTNLNYV